MGEERARAREVLASVVDDSSAWAAKHIRIGSGGDGSDALSISVRDALKAMLAFADEARLAERERCARLAEERFADPGYHPFMMNAALGIATAIRKPHP